MFYIFDFIYVIYINKRRLSIYSFVLNIQTRLNGADLFGFCDKFFIGIFYSGQKIMKTARQ